MRADDRTRPSRATTGLPALRATLALMALAAGLAPAGARAQDAPGAYVTAESTPAPEDQVAVAAIIARMNHAVDLDDYPLYASLYAADGVIDSGFGEPVAGHDAIVASLEQSAPSITNTRHAATNIVLHGSGDAATAVHYLLVFERAAGLTLAGTPVITDTFARGEDGWHVTRHQTRMDPATLAAMQQADAGRPKASPLRLTPQETA